MKEVVAVGGGSPHQIRDMTPRVLPREVLKLVEPKKVRSRIEHFLKKSGSVSNVLFTVATSYKQWFVKLAHREESFHPILFKKISNKNYVGLLEGNINAIQNFCPS